MEWSDALLGLGFALYLYAGVFLVGLPGMSPGGGNPSQSGPQLISIVTPGDGEPCGQDEWRIA